LGWTASDQEQLVEIAGALAGVLPRLLHTASLEDQLSQARQAALAAESSAVEAGRQNETLLAQLDSLQTQASQERGRAESLAALVSAQEAAQEAIARLQAENDRLAHAARRLPIQEKLTPDEVQHLQGELRLALEEVARLRGMLSEADQKVLSLGKPPLALPAANGQAEAVASIAQDLRQPLASIQGYTDLLLSESIGILGALQRKFLERVQVATVRVDDLLEVLVRTAAASGRRLELDAGPVDLPELIAEVVAATHAQRSAKNIHLTLKLPSEESDQQLPQIRADRDALHQALSDLLQFIGSTTPVDGEIAMRARLEAGEKDQDYILIEISDQGGGIPPEEQDKVFARLYRGKSDNPAGGGLPGDGGAGLSVVKTLIEAQGGRVWLDSRPGDGTTFSLLLPVSPAQFSDNSI
jgi:signal transduction histidine kinase